MVMDANNIIYMVSPEYLCNERMKVWWKYACKRVRWTMHERMLYNGIYGPTGMLKKVYDRIMILINMTRRKGVRLLVHHMLRAVEN